MRYERDGFVINGQVYHPRCRDAGGAAGVDLLIVATKYRALRPALGDIQTVAGGHATVMSLMNGVDSEEIIGEVIDPSQIVHSLIKVASERKGNQWFLIRRRPSVLYMERRILAEAPDALRR